MLVQIISAPNYVSQEYIADEASRYHISLDVALALIRCESGGNIYARHYNDNGTADYSLFQINSTHKKEAASRGDDITTARGNIDYGMWLLSTQGLSAWRASRFCWEPILDELS